MQVERYNPQEVCCRIDFLFIYVVRTQQDHPNKECKTGDRLSYVDNFVIESSHTQGIQSMFQVHDQILKQGPSAGVPKYACAM